MEAISYQTATEENKENLQCSNIQNAILPDGDEAALKAAEQRYLSFEELEPIESLSQGESFVEHVKREIQSEDWVAQFDTLNVLRRLNKFHRQEMSPYMETLSPLIAEAVESLRSNISKNALLLVTEIFSFPAEGQVNDRILDFLLPVVFLKAINDKQFICSQAQNAINCVSTNWLYEETLLALADRCEEKNAKISIKGAETLLATLNSLGQEFKELSNVNLIVSRLAALLNIKRADTLRQVKKVFLKLQSIYGADRFMTIVESIGDSKVTSKVKDALSTTTKKTSAASRGGFRAFLQKQKSLVTEDSKSQVLIKNADNQDPHSRYMSFREKESERQRERERFIHGHSKKSDGNTN